LAKVHIKRCSTPLIIREIHSKNIMSHHLISVMVVRGEREREKEERKWRIWRKETP
jgi:hypothetical protein